MTLARRARMGVLALTAVGLTAAALTVPAQAAAPAYAPGDVVTVNGIAVTAPATAGSVILNVTRVDGSQTLSVTTDDAGRVTIGDGSDAVAPAAPDAPAGGDKCDDPAYSLINGSSWPNAYSWAFRKSTTPNEMTRKAATRELKKAVNNISNGSNNCGLADQIDLPNNYQGSTSQPSDVTSQPACVSNPQPLNVTEFGPMGGGGILAATCTYTSGGNITNADVRINTNFEWWEGSGSCSGSTYGLQGVQTHEYGHAVGVGHVSEATSPNLTMSTNINGPCSNFEASLGRGDVLALRDLY